MTPKDPNYKSKVLESFAQQKVMGTLGATLTVVEPGYVEITLPYREDLTQQHGFLHAGIVATILDSACGYAAFSLMPPFSAVLTTEYKINLLSPAIGDQLIARSNVVKAGRTLTVSTGNVFAETDGSEKHIATMVSTLICLPDSE